MQSSRTKDAVNASQNSSNNTNKCNPQEHTDATMMVGYSSNNTNKCNPQELLLYNIS